MFSCSELSRFANFTRRYCPGPAVMNSVVDRFCGFVDLGYGPRFSTIFCEDVGGLSNSSKVSFLSLSTLCSYSTGLYVYPVLWHNRCVHKRTSRPRKNKATEWAIGQPLSFPLKGKISEPAKRPKSKPLDNKRTAES
jgi:hypothetical protein